MSEEAKKDEGIAGTTEQESSASAVPDSKLDGVVAGRANHKDFAIVKLEDKSSPKLYE